ncbi:accessory factor UbiK family protein [Bartonella sp. DGB2]|uniref:accessory factor UbiK family protein n=1 Tax=Bartonella sp. DGB2 TaxID=3388426 RepID=UPI00398FC1BF
MSDGKNRLLDEMAKLMMDATGFAQGVGREVETAFRSQAEQLLNRLDVVRREEFEVIKDMVEKLYEENVVLKDRLAVLEQKIFLHEND